MYFSEKSLKSRPIHFNTKFDSPQNGSSNLRIPEEKNTQSALERSRFSSQSIWNREAAHQPAPKEIAGLIIVTVYENHESSIKPLFLSGVR